MALPSTISTTLTLASTGHSGPYIDTDGDLFVVGVYGFRIYVMRSADGGDTWASSVYMSDVTMQAYDSTQSGSTLYIVGEGVNAGDKGGYDLTFYYREFSMATNAWTGTTDTVYSYNGTLTASYRPCISKRSSDTVILHQKIDNSDNL